MQLKLLNYLGGVYNLEFTPAYVYFYLDNTTYIIIESWLLYKRDVFVFLRNFKLKIIFPEDFSIPEPLLIYFGTIKILRNT